MKCYAALDVLYLHQLFEATKEQLNSFNYRLDKLATKYFITALQPTGLPVDQERLTVQRDRNLARIAAIALPINANSYIQVRKYIESDESDDLGLAKLSLLGNARATAVRETRKLLKENSFLAKFTGSRIYGKFTPSTRSGRSASKSQNLQQLPRSTKGLFGYPIDSTRCIIFSDYAQLELRCATVAVPEHLMLKLMTEGEDMHNYVAAQIFGADFTKQQRQIAKTCNFNLLYGGSPAMLQSILIAKADVWLELDEVKEISAKWLNMFSGFSSWHQKGISAWRGKRLWQTPSGRQYLGKLMTDQVNIMIQGMGAEVALLAMHYMLRDGWFAANDVRLANFVHDSYIFDAPNDPLVYAEASKRTATAMQSAWTEVIQQCPIKELAMPVQVLVGFNWGDIEKGDYFYEYKI
jgi:DNA polymerase I-like protein with 3'-5' exonuclease and polymerase domains